MKIKTSELTGAALDWAVAKCDGIKKVDGLGVAWVQDPTLPHFNKPFRPSADWSQGGRIIEREDIATSPLPDGLWRAYAPEGTHWAAHGERKREVFKWKHKAEGYTLLIAAMRCYVASKLGDEVDIPEELT